MYNKDKNKALAENSVKGTKEKAKSYKFFAFLNRLKLIQRWSLMHNRCVEDVAQHSHQTAVIAHALGLIDLTVFKKDTNPEKCAVVALYHETAEVLTGDMPTPVKYRNEKMTEAYKDAEKSAEERLLGYLPKELIPEIEKVVRPKACREATLVKYADKIAAYIKCVEEISAGNSEFSAAKKSSEAFIKAFNDEAVDFFMSRFADSFSMNLDELLED